MPQPSTQPARIAPPNGWAHGGPSPAIPAWLLWPLLAATAACGETGARSAIAADDGGSVADAATADDSGVAGDGPDATHRRALRVLFIGNSYTGVNDLPNVVARLGESAATPWRFDVGQYTPGGQTLEGHDADPMVDGLIDQGWDYVVLQDQSQQPWWGPPLDVKPALLSLDAKIRAASAETVLYMTWARQGNDFNQNMLVDSYYVHGADAVGARVAPVGRAWERALRDPTMTLHADDGSHPNPRGTYLAACVLYATLTDENPLGLGDGGLAVGEEDAARLQRVAWEAIAARHRPTPPLLWDGSLTGTTTGNDLIPSAELDLGDAIGPDGVLGSATSFASGRYAGIPYFAGLNTAAVTVSFAAFRDDWSEPTEHREDFVDRGEIYRLHLDATTLTATVYAAADHDPSPTPMTPSIPARPPPPPPSTSVAYDLAGLAAGWHRITLTHDGAIDRLWIDDEEVAAAPASGPIACATPEPGCNIGVILGVDGPSTAAAPAPSRFPFTGALAGLQIYAAALTAAQIQAL